MRKLRKGRGSFAERELKTGFIRFLRANALRLSVFLLLVALLAALCSLFMRGYVLGLAHGALVVVTATAIYQLFVLGTGQSHRLAGKWGEDNTRNLLRAAKRRGHVHDWIDNLEIQGGDVDHLVIAPSGVFAIDSKWHGVDLDEWVLERDTKAAIEGARRARLVLHSEKHRDEVTPLVVVWGGSQRQVPEHGIRVNDVLVIRGERLRRWLAYQAASASPSSATELAT